MAPVRRVGYATFRQLVRVSATRIVPVGFIIGAGMEAFMYYTGFWNTALRKEGERRAEAASQMEALRKASASKPPGTPQLQ